MAKIDSCDKVIGNGQTVVAAGAYKDGEATKYKFGLQINLPSKADMGEELTDKIFNVGLHRVMSVAAAGTFNKANDYGSQEEAEAFVEQFSSVDGWVKAFEKARREGGAPKTDSTETLAIRMLATNMKAAYEKDKFATAKAPIPRLDDPPKTEKGAINYNAWAKILKAEEHPAYAASLKKVQAAAKTEF